MKIGFIGLGTMDCPMTLGASYLDAPVSGGEIDAKAASRTIMVSGPEPGNAGGTR